MRLDCWEDYAGGILILTYYDSADAQLTQATLTVTRCLYGVSPPSLHPFPPCGPAFVAVFPWFFCSPCFLVVPMCPFCYSHFPYFVPHVILIVPPFLPQVIPLVFLLVPVFPILPSFPVFVPRSCKPVIISHMFSCIGVLEAQLGLALLSPHSRN